LGCSLALRPRPDNCLASWGAWLTNSQQENREETMPRGVSGALLCLMFLGTATLAAEKHVAFAHSWPEAAQG
jgi:hypothetical protein